MKEINYKGKFLETENIYLRPFIKEDADFFTKWYNDFDTRSKIGEVNPTSSIEAEKIIEGMIKTVFGLLLLENQITK